MTLNTNGYTLRGQETGLNLFAAIDAVTDVMDRQIQTYKGRVYRSARGKRPARASTAAPAGIMADQEPDRPMRTKRFRMRPMSLDDAALEMELLSHDFFFYNGKTGEYNVVYRRSDGDYGVIEPELD